MFQSKVYQRYFVVNHHDDSVQQLEQSKKDISLQNQQIIEQWDQRLEQQEETIQLAKAVVAKTNHTLWFKRNKWL
jgi:hypothetical protein